MCTSNEYGYSDSSSERKSRGNVHSNNRISSTDSRLMKNLSWLDQAMQDCKTETASARRRQMTFYQIIQRTR